jgi:hypothetical protein
MPRISNANNYSSMPAPLPQSAGVSPSKDAKKMQDDVNSARKEVAKLRLRCKELESEAVRILMPQ